MTVALQDHPALACRLGCEPVESTVARETEEMMKRLTEGGEEGEGRVA